MANMRPSWPPPMTPTVLPGRNTRGSIMAGRIPILPRFASPGNRAGRFGPARRAKRECRRPAGLHCGLPRSRWRASRLARPAGIWTMERSESTPFSMRLSTGTPSTGSHVWAAIMPGRCAAPPAPAMMTWMPRPAASLANEAMRSGVRWAETMRDSRGIPKLSNSSTACRMVSQSDLLPITTATAGAFIILL